jgi:hypothetical protein
VEPERGTRQRKRGGDDKDAVTIKGKVEVRKKNDCDGVSSFK